MRNAKGQFIKGERVSPTTEFKKGEAPWNKGKRGYMGANATSFNTDIFGELHPSWKGGLQKLKEGYYVNLGKNKRQKRARWEWEQHFGEIPKGYVIYHKDGDVYNDDIGNLEAITRAELIHRNTRE